MAPPPCLSVAAENAVAKHGWGTVYSLLEALSKAHSVHVEVAPHGCFVKAFYTKKCAGASSHGTASSTRCSSPPSVSSGRSSQTSGLLTREEILSMRPATVSSFSSGPSRLQSVKVFDMSDGAKDVVRSETSPASQSTTATSPLLSKCSSQCPSSPPQSPVASVPEAFHMDANSDDGSQDDLTKRVGRLEALLFLTDVERFKDIDENIKRFKARTKREPSVGDSTRQSFPAHISSDTVTQKENEDSNVLMIRDQRDQVVSHKDNPKSEGVDVTSPAPTMADAIVQTTEELSETLETKHQQLHAFFTRTLDDCDYVSCKVQEAVSRTEIIINAHNSRKVLGDRGVRIRELAVQLRQHFEIPLELSCELFVERF